MLTQSKRWSLPPKIPIVTQKPPSLFFIQETSATTNTPALKIEEKKINRLPRGRRTFINNLDDESSPTCVKGLHTHVSFFRLIPFPLHLRAEQPLWGYIMAHRNAHSSYFALPPLLLLSRYLRVAAAASSRRRWEFNSEEISGVRLLCAAHWRFDSCKRNGISL